MIAATNATKGRTTAMRFTERSTLVMSWTLPTTPAANWRVHARADRQFLELRHKFRRNRPLTRHTLAHLVVRQVRRRPEPQPPPAAVARDAGRGERPLERVSVRRFERQEPGDPVERHAAITREHRRREVERVDLGGEQRDLVAVGGLEHRRRQPALSEEA